MDIRILFANVAQGGTFLGKDDRGVESWRPADAEAIANDLSSFNPDIVCLAETLMDDAQGASAMTDTIAARLNLHNVRNYVVGEAFEPFAQGKFYGLSILSRFPLTDYEVIPLPNPGLRAEQPNGEIWQMHGKSVQKASVVLPGERLVNLFNVHSYPFHRFGRTLAEPEFTGWRQAFADALKTPDGKPGLWAGDFNNVGVAIETLLRDDFARGHMRDAVTAADPVLAQFADARTGGYFTRDVDHILHTPEFEKISGLSIHGRSDHPWRFAHLQLGD
jgi:endonuclease/exonuclease/phosphatase family metal-dependent hydrolase